MTPCVLLFVDHPRRQESHQRTPLFFEPEFKTGFSLSYVQLVVDLFVGVADVFLKFFPLKAKLLGGHHFSNLRPWPHLALKLINLSPFPCFSSAR